MGTKREIDKGMDLNLCRPVTEGQPGDTVLWLSRTASHGDTGELLRVKNGGAAIEWAGATHLDVGKVENIVLAPICWVEGKPVYAGDELVHCDVGKVTVTGPSGTHGVSVTSFCGYIHGTVGKLSWPKKEHTLRLALFKDGNACILNDDIHGVDPEKGEVRLIRWEA